MRQLSPEEATALDRFVKQSQQLRRVDRLDLTLRASNRLIDRIIADVGDANSELMVHLLRQKVNNYRGLRHREELLRFVQKLVALSTKRVRATEELNL